MQYELTPKTNQPTQVRRSSPCDESVIMGSLLSSLAKHSSKMVANNGTSFTALLTQGTSATNVLRRAPTDYIKGFGFDATICDRVLPVRDCQHGRFRPHWGHSGVKALSPSTGMRFWKALRNTFARKFGHLVGQPHPKSDRQSSFHLTRS